MVLDISFLVGAIGGTFFISPMYGDFPDVAGEVYGVFSFEPETLVLVLDGSKDYNYTNLQETLNGTDGVQSISVREVSITTSNFTEAFADRIQYSLYNINSSYKNCTIDAKNGIINLTLEDGADPYGAVQSMAQYLSLVSDTSPASTSVIVEVNVTPNSVQSVESKLSDLGVGVTGSEGPVSDFVKYCKDNALSFNELVVVTGVIGIVVGLIGIFVDNILRFKRKTGKKMAETYKGISEKRKSNNDNDADDDLGITTNSIKSENKKVDENKPIIIKDIDEKSIGAKKEDKTINFVDKDNESEDINKTADGLSKLIDKPVNNENSLKEHPKDNSLENKSITKSDNIKEAPVIKLDDEEFSNDNSKDSLKLYDINNEDSNEGSKNISNNDKDFLYPKPSKKSKK